MFERRDVWSLSEQDPWHPTIEWYARAVAELRSRDGADLSDTTSWGYLAAVHGTDVPRSRWPQGATWNQCQHASWFFLPWHRMYLHYFESVVRAAVVQLGGPADWALPYWDYSDPGRQGVRTLPPAFQQPQTPSGAPNPLFAAERAPGMNGGGRLRASSVLLGDAMREKVFADPTGGSAGFGGGVTGWNDAGGRVGSLENLPHGAVHVEVGGLNPRGWMSRFQTAGLDPVFWLHHANLDRLWEAWLAQGGGRANPTSTKWLGMKFTIGSGARALTLAVRDLLDTTEPPLEYRYQSLAIPGAEAGPVPSWKAAGLAVEEVPMSDDVPAEMVGATEKRVPLGSARSDAVVFVSAPTGPALKAAAEVVARPQRVYLKIENVEGSELAAPSYLVHVNLPAGTEAAEHPERRAGQVSLFGVAEASRGDEEHGGGGLTFSFDITDVARRLQDEGDWDPGRLRVTFTPLGAGGEDEDGQESTTPPRQGDVSAGRVSLFFA